MAAVFRAPSAARPRSHKALARRFPETGGLLATCLASAVVLVLLTCLFASTNASASQAPSLSTMGPLDSLAVQQAELTAFNGVAGDYFGYAVAVSGDTALVSNLAGTAAQGAVYVFVRTVGGWSQQAKLMAFDAEAGDHFGYAVALSGDTALVGAPAHTVGGRVEQGCAYIFTRSGGTWDEGVKIVDSDGAAGEEFGRSVALSGDTALMGMYDDAGPSDPVDAWVFVRSGAVWVQQAELTVPSAHDSYIGYSVAVSGDTALVGAEADTVNGALRQGSAYVFVRTGATWGPPTRLVADDGATDDYFGFSVALSGDTALVGAWHDDVGAKTDQGSAYVFARSNGSWSQQAMLTAADGTAYQYLGRSVAIDGDAAVVSENSAPGSAYLFARSGTSWSQKAKLVPTPVESSDSFGCSAAVSGHTALVGAYDRSVGSTAHLGAAFVFTFDVKPPVTTASLSPPPNSAGWNNAPVTVTLSASDDSAGVASIGYGLPGSGTWADYSGPFTVSGDGVTSYAYGSIDSAGNAEPHEILTIRIDTTPPVTSANGVPAGWSKTPVNIGLAGNDYGSGPGFTEYKLGDALWIAGNALSIGAQGITTLSYRSTDVSGNVEDTKTAAVRIDGRQPRTIAYTAAVVRGKRVSLAYKVSDPSPGSGQASVVLKIFRGTKLRKSLAIGVRKTNLKQTYRWRCALARGLYAIRVYATDLAGNTQAKVGSARLTVL